MLFADMGSSIRTIGDGFTVDVAVDDVTLVVISAVVLVAIFAADVIASTVGVVVAVVTTDNTEDFSSC